LFRLLRSSSAFSGTKSGVSVEEAGVASWVTPTETDADGAAFFDAAFAGRCFLGWGFGLFLAEGFPFGGVPLGLALWAEAPARFAPPAFAGEGEGFFPTMTFTPGGGFGWRSAPVAPAHRIKTQLERMNGGKDSP
jgi:hypothetical protein